MPEDRFDDKIRELLSKAQEEYDITSWDALSNRLDEAEDLSSDTEFIPIVKEKLDNHRSHPSEEHWDALKSDLDYIEERKERLYIIKALEAAVVLLLVLTYFNYQSYHSDLDLDIAYIEEVQSSIEDPNLISAALATPSVNADISDMRHSSINRISTFSTVLGESSLRALTVNVMDGMKNAVNNHATDLLHISDIHPTLPSSTDLSKLEINAFDIERLAPSVPAAAPSSSEERIKKSGWSVGLPISYDINFINTEINLGYLSNQIESGLAGKSIGVTLAYRKGNYEIESGLRYSQKTFVPGLLTNYTKSGANSFLESQLDHMVIKQIQIPLLAKLYAANHKGAALYGVAGIALNNIVENKYAIRRSVQSKARFANAPTSDVVDLRNLPKGLVHGGSLSENTYITGVIGFGIQSLINDQVSWYIQPQYQHSFTSEINELVSKVNVLSIEGGLKFSF